MENTGNRPLHADEAVESEKNGITEEQRALARRTREIILSSLDRHVLIHELGQILHVSPTQIKSCFRKVYGVPVYSFARARRMDKAARMLEDSDETVLVIAGSCGYENGSKFSKAFREVKGVSPSEYRRRIRWERENRPEDSDCESIWP
ncbi:MAG: AraC family transcriptional regulator [Eubacteriales bacterium]|nr:AraC family transcriptional regulator [Eubacteriales bacterium]